MGGDHQKGEIRGRISSALTSVAKDNLVMEIYEKNRDKVSAETLRG